MRNSHHSDSKEKNTKKPIKAAAAVVLTHALSGGLQSAHADHLDTTQGNHAQQSNHCNMQVQLPNNIEKNPALQEKINAIITQARQDCDALLMNESSSMNFEFDWNALDEAVQKETGNIKYSKNPLIRAVMKILKNFPNIDISADELGNPKV